MFSFDARYGYYEPYVITETPGIPRNFDKTPPVRTRVEAWDATMAGRMKTWSRDASQSNRVAVREHKVELTFPIPKHRNTKNPEP